MEALAALLASHAARPMEITPTSRQPLRDLPPPVAMDSRASLAAAAACEGPGQKRVAWHVTERKRIEKLERKVLEDEFMDFQLVGVKSAKRAKRSKSDHRSRACACPSAAAGARPAVGGVAVWGKGRDRCV